MAFGRDWKRDAERRDFTMNALSPSRDGTVHDHVGGLADIAARRVRFIGDAATRIAEDYLRILRFFRFHAAYGEGAPDPDGVAACIAGRAGLDQLSRERVRTEMLKLLVARHAVPALAVMTEAGLLEQVLGGVPLLASFANMIKLEAALALVARSRCAGSARSRVTVVEDAERLRERLRLANAEYERLASMADGWWRISCGDGRARAGARCSIGSGRRNSSTACCWPGRARRKARRISAGTRSRRCPARWTAPVFPLKAADFIARGVAEGPAARRGVARRRGGVDRGRLSGR